MKYKLVTTKTFDRSFEKLERNKIFNVKNFLKVIDTLLDKEVLERKYKNHKLKGGYEGCMECHLQNDILLIYYYIEKDLVLYAVNIGSHSELF